MDVWVLKCNGTFGKCFLRMLNVPGSEKIIASGLVSEIFSTTDSNTLMSVFLGKMFIVSSALAQLSWIAWIVFFNTSKSFTLFCLILKEVKGTQI